MPDKTAMVVFQPSGKMGRVSKGISLIEASRLLGVKIEMPCGEQQVCGKCKVRIEKGVFEKYGITSGMSNVSPWQNVEDQHIVLEEKAAGYRLGCVAQIKGDLLIFVLKESRAGKQIISKTHRQIPIDHNPAVKTYYVKIDKPSLSAHALGDFDRIVKALKKQHGIVSSKIDIQTLRMLPTVLRIADWKVTVSVWMNQEIIRVRPGKAKATYGLAIDVGTTTLAGYLCDLSTMEVIGTVTLTNHQCKYGEDVITRITYHMATPDGLQQMSDEIIHAINLIVEQAVQSSHPSNQEVMEKTETRISGQNKKKADFYLTIEDIEDITIGCNTVMHHILLKLNPEYLGVIPFPPVIQHSLNIKARDLGIMVNPSANIYFLPNEAGFVGADNVGVLIAEEPYNTEDIQLIIDIGTNGEIVLGNSHKLISSSCATGPALEGSQIKFGMRPAPGLLNKLISIRTPIKLIIRLLVAMLGKDTLMLMT